MGLNRNRCVSVDSKRQYCLNLCWFGIEIDGFIRYESLVACFCAPFAVALASSDSCVRVRVGLR